MPKQQAKKKKTTKKKAVVSAPAVNSPTNERMASASGLLKQSHRLLWGNKKLFGGLLACIGTVQLFVVQGIVRTDFVTINKDIQDLFGGRGIDSSFISYGYLLGSAGQSTGAGLLQSLFSILAVLALLWTCRELAAGNTPRIRDTFYKSTSPLIPFVLVTAWVGLQLLPAVMGVWLYGVVSTNGIAVHVYEQVLWLVVCIALGLVSLRWVLGSVFALVIVTLPDMAPMAAIRSARNLVYKRRLKILWRIVCMMITVLLMVTIITVPAIAFVPAIVPLLFYAVGLIALAIAVTYVYGLYRELLK